MNNKGFMMAEVVVVSSIILVFLVGMYTSVNKLFSLYNQRINYYDVATLYKLREISDDIDLDSYKDSIMEKIYDENGKTIYFVNKYQISNLPMNEENKTFKDYIYYLSDSLMMDELKVNDKEVDHIMIMENCGEGTTEVYDKNCKYAYLEVLFDDEVE